MTSNIGIISYIGPSQVYLYNTIQTKSNLKCFTVQGHTITLKYIKNKKGDISKNKKSSAAQDIEQKLEIVSITGSDKQVFILSLDRNTSTSNTNLIYQIVRTFTFLHHFFKLTSVCYNVTGV